VLAGASPCGRTNVRIKGWMGRADQTTKVRGMFVTPKQVGEIVRRHPEIAKARLVVAGSTGNDTMTLRCELRNEGADLNAALVASIRDVTKLRGEIEFVPAGSLPNDGMVFDDSRKYELHQAASSQPSSSFKAPARCRSRTRYSRSSASGKFRKRRLMSP